MTNMYKNDKIKFERSIIENYKAWKSIIIEDFKVKCEDWIENDINVLKMDIAAYFGSNLKKTILDDYDGYDLYKLIEYVIELENELDNYKNEEMLRNTNAK